LSQKACGSTPCRCKNPDVVSGARVSSKSNTTAIVSCIVDFSLSYSSAVGTPVTRRPPHSPGRAVFPPPVPRWDALPRQAGAQADTRRRRRAVRRGRALGTAASRRVTRGPRTLRRCPPRRWSHVNAPVLAHAQTRGRALEWPGPPSSWSGPRTRAFRPLQTAFPGPCRGARLPSVIRWPALCPVVRAGRRVTRGRPCRSSGQQHATPKPGNRRGRPG
jgi:hypothetical protein